MSASNLVIVESPAKAKTINKYLGDDYKVIASFGHIRDLPSKNGSVDPDADFDMKWETGERSKKHVTEILKLSKQSKTIWLATDPDREGEAISWHILEVLKEKKLLDKLDVKRVSFNEVTKTAVNHAFSQAREVDMPMVDAYLARRALDYLVGFTLSPILWRKLPGSRSAGRVQSVALRLVCERETEIEAFNPVEYWSIEAQLSTDDNKSFTARLHTVDGKRLGKLDIQNEEQATELFNRLKDSNLTVNKIERKQSKRNPYAPFITSTLQQDASRKLGYGATKTMRLAQKLYEGVDIGGETVGLITYMRTDGVTLSQDAIAAAREFVQNKYGAEYVPDSPRVYKSKAKNAQEAHEAIRPTDMFRNPDEVSKYVDEDAARLYALIWRRTMACQMSSAKLDQVSVDIKNSAGDFMFRASGSIIAFDGFLKVYKIGLDDDEKGEQEKRLPALQEKQALSTEEVTPNQHFTQPPPRYTEASLVKRMEELGIGRPSTYASILQVLRDRDYVILDKKRFIPESRGRIVTTFLTNFFRKYVEYNFTAELEEQLDTVSEGKLDYKKVLSDFWGDFSETVGKTKELRITEVIDALNVELAHMLFPVDPEKPDENPRKCPKCDDGELSLKLGKFGAFVGCSNYPECKLTRPFANADGSEPDSGEPKELGTDPTTGGSVTLRSGPYGPYVQLDLPKVEEPKTEDKPAPEPEPELDAKGKKKKPKKKKKKAAPKPKRTSIPQGMDQYDVDLAKALQLLSLPREIGNHPESKEMIKAGIGRFGPYLVHKGKFKSIPKDDPEGVLTIGLNRAVILLAQESKGGFGELKKIGEHPTEKVPVTLNRGRFGTYIKCGKTNAPIPKNIEANDITLEKAVELIAAKAEKDAAKKGTKKAVKKPAKKPAKKKAPAKKKPAAKKKATKKDS